MIDVDPDKKYQFEDLQSKPKMVLTEEELKEEQTLLREKLKAVNKNLDRIVNKELVI